jgi:hypothetical protein
MSKLSPRLAFSLRYCAAYEPWFGQLQSYESDSVLSVVCNHGWTELFARRKLSRQWTLLGAFPTSFWRSLHDDEKEFLKMSYLEKFSSAACATPPPASPADKQFQKQFPAISEFCWSTAWPDGTVRTPSSLTFFCEEGQWKVCLSERDRGVSLWGSGPTFEIALQCLEDRLSSDRPDWRKAKRQKRS